MYNRVNRVNSLGEYWKKGGQWVDNGKTNGKMGEF
jgi:hypothetical protein